MTAAPNAIVRTLDDVWTSVGRLFNLPSLQQQQQRQQQVQPEPAPSTTIPLPGGREARLKLLSVAGDYDFGRRSSQYTAMMALGKTMLLLNHDVLTNTGLVEWEGAMWEVGYSHAGRRVHAKKKWRVGKNAMFIARQDVANGDWARVPSPELQLEHVVFNVAGLQKHQLDLNYDTFSQVSTLVHEARVNKYLTVSSAADSVTKLDGAQLVLESSPGYRLLDGLKVIASRKAPVQLEYRMRPMQGVRLRAFADPVSKVVTGEVDLAAGRDGMSVELQSFVSSAGWAKPQVHIGFRF